MWLFWRHLSQFSDLSPIETQHQNCKENEENYNLLRKHKSIVHYIYCKLDSILFLESIVESYELRVNSNRLNKLMSLNQSWSKLVVKVNDSSEKVVYVVTHKDSVVYCKLRSHSIRSIHSRELLDSA